MNAEDIDWLYKLYEQEYVNLLMKEAWYAGPEYTGYSGSTVNNPLDEIHKKSTQTDTERRLKILKIKMRELKSQNDFV